MKYEISKESNQQIKMRFCSFKYTENSQTHPAAKPVYSLNATSGSTIIAQLPQLGCRHTCKLDSSKKVSPTWERGRAGTRVLVVFI